MSIGVVVAAAVSLSAPSFAGEYHQGAQLVCSDCHTMHGSQNGQIWSVSSSLLKWSSTNSLCLSCHDGSDSMAPDVIASGTSASPNKTVATAYTSKYGSSAGSFQSDYASQANPAGHDMHGLSITAPGGGPTMATSMNCASCHEPHGTSNYRNLVERPNNDAQDITVTLGTDVIENVPVNAGAPNPSVAYDTGNVAYIHNTAAPTTAGMSNWCASCHPNFHENTPNKHVSDMSIPFTHWIATSGVGFGVDVEDGIPGIPRIRFEAAAGTSTFASATTVSSTNRVACVSCHKAHGSKYDSALVWPYYTQSETGKDRTSACGQCHDKGA